MGAARRFRLSGTSPARTLLSRQYGATMAAVVSLAGPYADLVYHVLAHVPVDGPSSVHDAHYLAWSRATLPEPARRPAEEDAEVMGVLYARTEGAALLHALPALHDDLPAFCASAAKGLGELEAHEVADHDLLRALLGIDRRLAEIVRCAMALAARAYGSAHAERVEPELRRAAAEIAPLFDDAMDLMPAMRHFRVELVHPLGPRGRVIGRRILVGAPVPWCGLPPAHPVLQAMHECAVACADGERRAAGVAAPQAGDTYVECEWRAMRAVEQVARGTAWQGRHAAWRGVFTTDELDAEARRLGVNGDVGSLVAVLREGDAGGLS